MRALITAGGTREPIDDVRSVTNSSTGRFGVAIARALAYRGVEVTLVGAASMDVSDLPLGVRFVTYTAFADLSSTLDRLLADPPDLLLMAAAVADYSPVVAAGKLSSDEDELTVRMVKNPKLLARLRERCPRAKIIGFKLLSGVTPDRLIAVAERQRVSNGLDVTVANDLAELTGGRHPLWWVDATGARRMEGPRDEVARQIAEQLVPAEVLGLRAVAGWPLVGRWQGWWAVPGAVAVDAVVADGPADFARQVYARGLRADRPLVVRCGEDVLFAGSDADAAPIGAVAGRAVLSRDGLVAWIEGDVVHDLGAPGAPLWSWALEARPWTLVTSRPVAFEAAGWRAGVPPQTQRDRREAASIALWDPLRQRVLLGVRSDGGVAFPGGKVEPGETADGAAVRELAEETGITLAEIKPVATFVAYVGPVWRVTTPVVVVLDDLTPVATPELDASWFALGAALRRRDLLPGVRRVLEWLAG